MTSPQIAAAWPRISKRIVVSSAAFKWRPQSFLEDSRFPSFLPANSPFALRAWFCLSRSLPPRHASGFSILGPAVRCSPSTRLARITSHFPPAAVRCGVGDCTRYLRSALAADDHDALVITSASTRSSELVTSLMGECWGSTDLTRVVRVIRSQRPDTIAYSRPCYFSGTARSPSPVTKLHSAGSPFGFLLPPGMALQCLSGRIDISLWLR